MNTVNAVMIWQENVSYPDPVVSWQIRDDEGTVIATSASTAGWTVPATDLTGYSHGDTPTVVVTPPESANGQTFELTIYDTLTGGYGDTWDRWESSYFTVNQVDEVIGDEDASDGEDVGVALVFRGGPLPRKTVGQVFP